MGYVLVLLLGMLTGLRTLTPFAVMCWFAYMQAVSTSAPAGCSPAGAVLSAIPSRLVSSPSWRSGNMLGTNCPTPPPAPLLSASQARVLFGTAVGVIIAPARRRPPPAERAYLVEWVLCSAHTAAGGSARSSLQRSAKTGRVANLEDWFTIAASILILNVITHSDFFR